MASISKDKRGNKSIQFIDADGKRRIVYLGKTPQRVVENIKTRTEHILAAKKADAPWDGPTAEWVAGIGDELADKLARVGLIPQRNRAVLERFLREYVGRRVDVKPATREVWRQVEQNLLDHFGKQTDLRTIDEPAAEDFKLFLQNKKLSFTTIAKRLQFARQFFKMAVKRKLLPNYSGPGFSGAGIRWIRR